MIRCAGILLASAMLFHAQEPASKLALMPWPAKIDVGQGSLDVGPTVRIAFHGYSEPRLVRGARRLGEIVSDEPQAALVIECAHASAAVQQLGEDESYHLSVTPQRALLSAPNPLGILHGLETFRQLVVSGRAPVVEIDDHPRFPWRGLHLDVSRHWMPINVIKRNLDGMAAVKLNVFHWHLSDDQGFRVESKRFPKLQELGSDRQYYTQEQVRDVIAYARDRGIRVIPEFDIPGHTTSWLVGYPQLASAPGPYQIERNWGVFDAAMDPTRESTYQFLDEFVSEMAGLFPDPFFHIGGDEVTGKQWNSNRRIRAFMRKHRLQTAADLQAYFNRRLQKILAKYGKRMEGWDEILDPNLPRSIVIQSWRGPKVLSRAAQQGFSAILSNGYYLDHMEPAAKLYAVDPLGGLSASLTDSEKARILGGEVAMWGEFVSPENVDSRIWPRTAAVAERLWSPADVTDVASMYERLEEVSAELDRLGVTQRASYLPMLERIAAGRPVAQFKTLGDVLTPGTFGQRYRTHKYNQQTPLVGLVDAVRPESGTAREFAALVERKDWVQVRIWLTRWRDVDPSLHPAAEALNRCAGIGLQALDDIGQNKRAPQAWVAQQRANLETLSKPVDEVRLAIVPSIENLLQAAASLPADGPTPAPPKHD